MTVVNDPPYRLIYVHGLLHSRFHLASPLDERHALVQLCEAGFITQKRLAEAYGHDQDTMNLWVKRYRRYGLAGLARGNPARLKPQDPTEPAPAGPPPAEQLHLELTDPPPPSEPQPVPAPGEPAPPVPPQPEGQEPRARVAVLRPGEARPSRYLGLLLALPLPSCRTLRRLLPWLSAHDLPRMLRVGKEAYTTVPDT